MTETDETPTVNLGSTRGGTPTDKVRAMKPPVDPAPPQTQLSRYAIRRTIARGGMGIVYEAQDLVLDRRVALKELLLTCPDDRDARKRFLREAQAIARLDHPNIVRVYDVGEDGERSFFAMEYLEGLSAEMTIETTGPLTIARTLDVLAEITTALQAALASGIVHRDVKPSNIMLSPGGPTKILDFGLAKFVDADATQTHGFITGTPAYMSPEQVNGAELDHRTDIYSLGATAYYLLTGAPPFDAPTPLALMKLHCEAPPPLVDSTRPDAPPELVGLIRRMLSKSREDRPQTYDEIATTLAHLRAHATDRPPVLTAAAPARFLSLLSGALFSPASVMQDRLLYRPLSQNMNYLAGIALVAECFLMVFPPDTGGPGGITLTHRLCIGYQVLMLCYAVPVLAAAASFALLKSSRVRCPFGALLSAEALTSSSTLILMTAILPHALWPALAIGTVIQLRARAAAVAALVPARSDLAWPISLGTTVLSLVLAVLFHFVVPGMLPSLLLPL